MITGKPRTLLLDVVRLESAEVVGGLEALVPCTTIHVGEGLHVRGGQEEVHGLGLVDPLLAPGGGINDVFVVDAEDGLVLELEGIRDIADGVQLTIEVLELIEHFLVPEAGFLEIADELGIEDDEVSGEIALHVEVLVIRLDARGGAGDVRDGGRWGDGEDV